MSNLDFYFFSSTIHLLVEFEINSQESVHTIESSAELVCVDISVQALFFSPQAGHLSG